jgi:hypothetical protein
LIISNLSEKGLQECLGPRVFDRLMEIDSTMVLFNWGSHRRGQPCSRSGEAEAI